MCCPAVVLYHTPSSLSGGTTNTDPLPPLLLPSTTTPTHPHRAKDLIRQLLGVDPRKRPTAAQCLASPWVTAGAVSSAPLTGAVNNMRMQMGVSYRSQRMQQGQAGGEAAPAAAGQQ